MIHAIWEAVLYKPLVNILAFLVSIVPGGDIGIAVIILTVFVKALLFPLSQRSIESQAKMKLIEADVQKIKESGASKEEQAKQTFELYKKNKINPFSGCLLVLIQLPIIFALYYVFLKGINLDSGLLYSFILAPEHVNTLFLGFLDLGIKSLPLALLAGASQYLQAHFLPKPVPSATSSGSFQESFSKSMHLQMKYIFPIVVTFIAYSVSGAVALYWITSNAFAVGQQIYSNKKHKVNLTTIVK